MALELLRLEPKALVLDVRERALGGAWVQALGPAAVAEVLTPAHPDSAQTCAVFGSFEEFQALACNVPERCDTPEELEALTLAAAAGAALQLAVQNASATGAAEASGG